MGRKSRPTRSNTPSKCEARKSLNASCPRDSSTHMRKKGVISSNWMTTAQNEKHTWSNTVQPTTTQYTQQHRRPTKVLQRCNVEVKSPPNGRCSFHHTTVSWDCVRLLLRSSLLTILRVSEDIVRRSGQQNLFAQRVAAPKSKTTQNNPWGLETVLLDNFPKRPLFYSTLASQ